MGFKENWDSWADVSVCEKYRYALGRVWQHRTPTLTIVMVNPSTADASVDDHTIRKCIGFAMRGGFGSIAVVNPYAWRATDIKDLNAAWMAGADIVGGRNRARIVETFEAAAFAGQPVLCAWGSRTKMPHNAPVQIERIYEHARIHGAKLVRLGKPTKSGDPQHPLTLGYDTPFVEISV